MMVNNQETVICIEWFYNFKEVCCKIWHMHVCLNMHMSSIVANKCIYITINYITVHVCIYYVRINMFITIISHGDPWLSFPKT